MIPSAKLKYFAIIFKPQSYNNAYPNQNMYYTRKKILINNPIIFIRMEEALASENQSD